MPLGGAEEVARQALRHLGQLHQRTRRAEHAGLHPTGQAHGAGLEGDRDRGARRAGRTRARARTRDDGAVQRDARRGGPFDDQPPEGSAEALEEPIEQLEGEDEDAQDHPARVQQQPAHPSPAALETIAKASAQHCGLRRHRLGESGNCLGGIAEDLGDGDGERLRRRLQFRRLLERVRVRGGAVGDVLGARGVLERLERLGVIGGRGGDGGEHGGVGVAPEGLLQDLGQLRGTIRDHLRL